MRNVSDAAGSFRLVVLLDAAVWLALALGCWIGWFQLTVIELLFLLAPWIVVPLATSLIPSLDGSEPLTGQQPALKWIILAAAASTTFSFFMRVGMRAATFAGAWLLVCALFTLQGLRRLWRYRAHSSLSSALQLAKRICLSRNMASGFTTGFATVGFQEPIVLLTAVIFTSRDSCLRCLPG